MAPDGFFFFFWSNMALSTFWVADPWFSIFLQQSLQTLQQNLLLKQNSTACRRRMYKIELLLQLLYYQQNTFPLFWCMVGRLTRTCTSFISVHVRKTNSRSHQWDPMSCVLSGMTQLSADFVVPLCVYLNMCTTLKASVAYLRIQSMQTSYQRPPLSPSPLQSHNALLHLNVSEQDYCELDRNILQLCGNTHTQLPTHFYAFSSLL